MIHQSYGVTQAVYRQAGYPVAPYAVSHSPPQQIAYPSAMQYQAISPMYGSQPTYRAPPPPPSRQHPAYGSPVRYNGGSPKHYEQPAAGYSPQHRGYGPPKGAYVNGELAQQQVGVCNTDRVLIVVY